MAIDALPKKNSFFQVTHCLHVKASPSLLIERCSICVHFKSNLKLFVPIPFKTTATTVCDSQ